MDSLISGIIDCVARPSTTDSPIRVIRKSDSESPNCASSDPGMVALTCDTDSESSFTHTHIPMPPNHGHGSMYVSSSSSLSRLMVPGSSGGDATQQTPINSVLTAEGIIMGDERNGFLCGNYCGDCATCYEANGGNDNMTCSSEPIDNGVVRQFEAAFATFLYKNPAFTSMSHTNIQKLRSKLLKESARNIRLEVELRQQLSDLREAKRNRELELQRELLVVTRAKAAREAELIIQIEKTRRSSMTLDQRMKVGGMPSRTAASFVASRPTPPSPPMATTHEASWFGFGPAPPSPSSPVISGSASNSTDSSSPIIAGTESFEEFQREIKKNKMEQAHILAEMEKIKMQIAEQTVNGTP